jgi:hypothetical protein
MKYVDIPDCFRAKINVNYPAHQRGELIEEFADRYYRDKPDANGFSYIPLHWCAWHVNNGYGKQKDACVRLLQDLPKGRYFTIAQYDGGTLIDDFLTEKGCVTFVCDCKIERNIIIPLLCDPHPVKRDDYTPFLCSFVGSFNTHPVRPALRDMYQRAPGFYFGHRDTVLFRNVMRQSRFTLCPRGSGITSFRLYEALQVGSIPIYVSDIFRCPFEGKIDWKEICLFFKLEEIGNIEQTVKAIPEKRVNEMRAAGQRAVEKYFNLRGTCDEILEVLKTL